MISTSRESTAVPAAMWVPSQAPTRVVAFEILERCNLSCSFCVRSAVHSAAGIVRASRFSDRAYAAARAFPELTLIAITGGEPFLHPELDQIISIASCAAPRVSITTNGTVIHTALLETLAQNEAVHIIVSLDGPSAAIHDVMRGQQGAFDRLIRFVELCCQLNLPFLVNMTVSNANKHLVYETVLLAEHIGARDVSVALVKPEGRGNSVVHAEDVLAEVGSQVLRAKRDTRSSFGVNFTDPLAHIVEPILARRAIRRGCGAASGALHVQVGGAILICTACKESLGNIDEVGDSLAERVSRDARLCAIAGRATLGGACGACDFREVCGGCRCRAAATDDGILGPDPLCPKNISQRHLNAVEKYFRHSYEQLKIARARCPSEVVQHLSVRVPEESWSFSDSVLDVDARTRAGLMSVLQWLLFTADIDSRRVLVLGAASLQTVLILATCATCVDVNGSPSHELEAEFWAQQYSLSLKAAGYSGERGSCSRPMRYDMAYLSHAYDELALRQALGVAATALTLQGHVLVDVVGNDSRGTERLSVLEMMKSAGFADATIIDFDVKGQCRISARRANE